MSAKLRSSCSSDRTGAESRTGTHHFPLPPRLLSRDPHPGEVRYCGECEPHKPRPIIDASEKPARGPAAQCGDEPGKAGRDAQDERADRHPVDPAAVLVGAWPAVEIVNG